MTRLPAIDFLRGAVLTVVLLDHIDWYAGEAALFRAFTPIGLGISDAAEGFVFLSGITFGWVYSERLGCNGFFRCQKRILLRTLQIYLGFCLTLATVAIGSLLLEGTSLSMRPAIQIESWDQFIAKMLSAMRLREQPFALGILCLYVVLLPFMLPLLVLLRQSRVAAVGLSLTLYTLVQVYPQWNFAAVHWSGRWPFNPFAWQFLFVLGMCCGNTARNDSPDYSRSRRWFLLPALVLLLLGLLMKKGSLLAADESRWIAPLLEWIDHPGAIEKARLAPLRLLHFLAVAVLVERVICREPFGSWAASAWPLLACGRYPLTIYCFGVLLTYASLPLLDLIGPTRSGVLMLGLDAVVAQFAFALWLDHRTHREVPVGDSAGKLTSGEPAT